VTGRTPILLIIKDSCLLTETLQLIHVAITKFIYKTSYGNDDEIAYFNVR